MEVEMKHKKLMILVMVMGLSIFFTTSVLAFDGVKGSVIDSKDKEPWSHGGDVYVLTNGSIAATGQLSSTGTFTLTYGTDILGQCTSPPGCTTPGNGDTIEIYIDFECTVSGDSCNPPEGYPSTNNDCTYSEQGLPFTYNCGYIETGTGPTAIVLNNLTARSVGVNPWVVFALAVGAIAFVGGGYIFLRRKES